MKNYIISFALVFSLLQGNAQEFEWKLPTIDVTLMQGGEMKAVLALSPVSNKAILAYDGEEYQLKFSKITRSCEIISARTGEKVAIAKRILRRSGTFEFTNGQDFAVSKRRENKVRVYQTGSGSTLSVSGEKLVSSIVNLTTEQIIIHSVMTFKKVRSMLDESKSSNGYPIIIVQP